MSLMLTESLQTMYAGVLRDEARQAAKKEERAREFEEQARRRAYLESQQSVSNATEYSRPTIPVNDGMTAVEFQGCKTC